MRLYTLICTHEGYREEVYADTKGLLTWGYGWCLDRRPLLMSEAIQILQLVGGEFSPGDLVWDKKILTAFLNGMPSRHKRIVAMKMLKNEVDHVVEKLPKSLDFWGKLDEVRQSALIDMAYNMGVNGLLGFVNTLAAIKEGRWKDAESGILSSTYAKETGTRSKRIAYMILTGGWPKDITWGENA